MFFNSESKTADNFAF